MVGVVSRDLAAPGHREDRNIAVLAVKLFEAVDGIDKALLGARIGRVKAVEGGRGAILDGVDPFGCFHVALFLMYY